MTAQLAGGLPDFTDARISLSVAKSSSFRQRLDRQVGRFIRKYRKTSDIKEHRLPITLEMDIEGVDGGTVSLGPCCDQHSASLRLLDDVQDRILGVRRFLVAKVHARGQADIDAAGGQPKIDVRRHRLAALAAGHASGLDGTNCINPSVEVRAGPGPAAEALIE